MVIWFKKTEKNNIWSIDSWFLWFFGLGVLGGWLLTKGGLEKFPEINKDDRILVVAPHIDDEVLGSGGLIQRALKSGAKVKIIYVTNGDDNLASVIANDKFYNPSDFISLGETRMAEGKKAAKIIGLTESDLLFLGYPDRGVDQLYSKNYSKVYTSQGTRFTYNPYQGTYREGQEYTGENLFSDLVEIFKDYQPTAVITTHLRDENVDHREVNLFVQKVKTELNSDWPMYTFLIHYTLYPPNKRLEKNRFLYPPRRLFTSNGWYSYDLSVEEEDIKLKAVDQNKSQMVTSKVVNLLESFVKKNEIFEMID